MRNNKPLFTIFAIVFIDLVGFGIVLPLLPFVAERFHANPAQIGFLTATYSIFQLVASPILGRLSDRFGRKKLLVLSQIGSAVGYLILAFANNLPLLFLARIIDGVTGGNISIAQAYIADVTDKENRAKGMGLIGAAFGLGFIFGPAIGGLLSKFGFIYPGLFAMVVGLITAALTYFVLPETVNVQKAEHSKRTAFSLGEFKKIVFQSSIGYLVVMFFLLNTAFSLFTNNFSLWVQQKFNFGPTEIGIYFAYIGILAVIIQIRILPWLLKRFDEKKLLRYSTGLLTLGFFFMPFIPSVAVMYLNQLFIALGNSISNPTLQALASENVAKEEYGGTLGFLQSAGSLGRIVGPIVGGELFYILGKDLPFFLSALLLAGAFIYLQFRLKK